MEAVFSFGAVTMVVSGGMVASAEDADGYPGAEMTGDTDSLPLSFEQTGLFDDRLAAWCGAAAFSGH